MFFLVDFKNEQSLVFQGMQLGNWYTGVTHGFDELA